MQWIIRKLCNRLVEVRMLIGLLLAYPKDSSGEIIREFIFDAAVLRQRHLEHREYRKKQSPAPAVNPFAPPAPATSPPSRSHVSLAITIGTVVRSEARGKDGCFRYHVAAEDGTRTEVRARGMWEAFLGQEIKSYGRIGGGRIFVPVYIVRGDQMTEKDFRTRAFARRR